MIQTIVTERKQGGWIVEAAVCGLWEQIHVLTFVPEDCWAATPDVGDFVVTVADCKFVGAK